MSPLKVVYIITGLSTGGAERALYNLLQGGLNTEFDCHVISLSDAGTMGAQIETLGVSVITLDMPIGRPTLAGVLKLRRVIKELQPDLIQGWMYHGNLAATLACGFTSSPPVLVWNIRQTLYDLNLEKPMTRQVIRANRLFSKFPGTLLYNSQISRQQHEVFGFRSKNGWVIPNGINLQQFYFSADSRRRVRTELAIPADALVVGHVARFHPIKDHPLFIRVATKLAWQYPDLHFILSGQNVVLQNKTLAELVPTELRNRFHLLGERADVHELMSAMDIASSSSRGEAFPNVVGEAMSASLPCVVTDVGDSAFIVGETGVVVPPCDDMALANGIESLLVLSEVERRKLGVNARKRIEDNFALSAIVKQYSLLYKSKINEKRKL